MVIVNFKHMALSRFRNNWRLSVGMCNNNASLNFVYLTQSISLNVFQGVFVIHYDLAILAVAVIGALHKAECDAVDRCPLSLVL